MRQFFFVILFACVIQPSARADQAGRTTFVDKGDDAKYDAHVLVSIGNSTLTAGDLKALAAFRAAPSVAAMQKDGTLSQNALGEKKTKYGIQGAFRRRAMADFIEGELLAAYARNKRLAPDAARRTAAESEVKQFCKAEKNDRYRPVLEKMVERLALAEAARKVIMVDFHYEPEPSVVSNVLDRVKIYNARIEATNQAVRVRAAQAALAAGRADADFGAIAMSNGVADARSDLEWAPMDTETFESDYPKMFEALGKCVVGTVSAPVEEDHALLVGKLVDKVAATEDEPAQFKVLCMRFPFAIKVTERSYAETREVLVAEKRQAFFLDALERIRQTVKMTVDKDALRLL